MTTTEKLIRNTHDLCIELNEVPNVGVTPSMQKELPHFTYYATSEIAAWEITGFGHCIDDALTDLNRQLKNMVKYAETDPELLAERFGKHDVLAEFWQNGGAAGFEFTSKEGDTMLDFDDAMEYLRILEATVYQPTA